MQTNFNIGLQKHALSAFLMVLSTICGLRAQDSLNILDYSDKLLLRVYTVTKLNTLSIQNREADKLLILEPNGNTNLGFGFNYKKFGLGIAFGLPRSEDRDRVYGKTQRFDVQGSMYGKKFGADGFFQAYKGYYNSNPKDFVDWTNDAFPQLNTMRVLSVGLAAFYVFNSDRYSYRAAFVRDEMQKESAGSFLLGIFGNFDESRTDSGFVPEEFPEDLRREIDVKEFQNLAMGISVGYAYNLIIKRRFIFGMALLPGFGYQRVTVKELNDNVKKEDQPAGQLLTRIGLGYEHPSFYLGLTGSVNLRSINLDPYDFNLATTQFRFVLGKRFDM